MGTNMENNILDSFASFDNMVQSSIEVLTSTDNSVWQSMINNVCEVLKPFCYMIIGICLLLEVANVAMKVDTIRWEQGLKLMVKIVLAKVCIDVAPSLLQACYYQAANWMVSIGDNIGLSSGGMGEELSAQVTELFDVAGNLGFLKWIGAMVSAGILWILIKGLSMMIYVMALARMFQIYVLVAISPLPCAFAPLGDGSGGGISRITTGFIKNFIGVCLQGVMMVVCFAVFSAVVASITPDIGATAAATSDEALTAIVNLCWMMVLYAIVLAIAIFQCGGWAKSIMGQA